jgi:hypothetical protein
MPETNLAKRADNIRQRVELQTMRPRPNPMGEGCASRRREFRDSCYYQVEWSMSFGSRSRSGVLANAASIIPGRSTPARGDAGYPGTPSPPDSRKSDRDSIGSRCVPSSPSGRRRLDLGRRHASRRRPAARVGVRRPRIVVRTAGASPTVWLLGGGGILGGGAQDEVRSAGEARRSIRHKRSSRSAIVVIDWRHRSALAVLTRRKKSCACGCRSGCQRPPHNSPMRLRRAGVNPAMVRGSCSSDRKWLKTSE